MKRPRRTSPTRKPKSPRAPAAGAPSPREPTPYRATFGATDFDHERFRKSLEGFRGGSGGEGKPPKPRISFNWASFLVKIAPVVVEALADQLSLPSSVEVTESSGAEVPSSAPPRDVLRLLPPPPPSLESLLLEPVVEGSANAQRRFDLLRMRLAAVSERLSILESAWGDAVKRAGGDVRCETCGFQYYDHPRHPGVDWLTILCGGSVVKL